MSKNALTLEQRVVAVLEGDAQSPDIAALIEETEAAIIEAEGAAESERTRALDPALSPDPVRARDAMQAAEFALERLRTLLPRLRERIGQVDAAERLARWRAEAEGIRAKRDALTAELAEVYPNLVDQLVDLLTRIKAVDTEIQRLGQAPDGSGGLGRVGGTASASRS